MILYRIVGILLFPIWFCYKDNILLKADLQRYIAISESATYFTFIKILIHNKPFRSVFYYRTREKKISRLIRCFIRPLPTIEINGSIDGGLYIPHSFAIISVYKAGCNLTVLPGVVIGKKGEGKRSQTNPEIGDNVLISSNCTIFGPIHIGNDVTVGAGSVVFCDIMDGCTVAGNPAKIISEKSRFIH